MKRNSPEEGKEKEKENQEESLVETPINKKSKFYLITPPLSDEKSPKNTLVLETPTKEAQSSNSTSLSNKNEDNVDDLMNMSLKKILEEVGNGKQTPGAGTVSGIAAALSIALEATLIIIMKNRRQESICSVCIEDMKCCLDIIRAKVNSFITEDSQNFQRFWDLKKKHCERDEDLIPCITEPIKISFLLIEIVRYGIFFIEYGSEQTRGDANTAYYLAVASVKSLEKICLENMNTFAKDQQRMKDYRTKLLEIKSLLDNLNIDNLQGNETITDLLKKDMDNDQSECCTFKKLEI